MLFFSLLGISLFGAKDVVLVTDEVKIDGLQFTCVFASNKYYAIGDGKKPALLQHTEKKTLTVPEKVTVNKTVYKLNNISSFAFANTNFVNISFPPLTDSDAVLNIGKHSFENCSNLVRVDFSKSKVKVIPQFAFYNCPRLSEALCGITSEVISAKAFFKSGITSVTIRAHFSFIGEYAFAGSELVEVDMEGSSLKSLPKSLFENCTKLSVVSLPRKLEAISSRCFFQTLVKKMVFPQTLSTLESSCFWNCTELSYVDMKHAKVSLLPKNGFEHCTKLDMISCSSNLHTISEYALSDTGIEEFIVPKSLTEIGSGFISQCKKLVLINLSNIEMRSIPSYSFYKCISLTTFVPPQKMQVIESYAFADTQIQEFSFHQLEEVNTGAFSQCKKLISADLSTLKSSHIPAELFDKCTSLKEIKWPKGDLVIGTRAFSDTAITNLEFPSKVVGIEESAFSNCVSLTNVDLTNVKLEQLPKSMFSGCGKMNIKWPVEQFSIGYSMFITSRIAEIKLPASCKHLMKKCFSHCKDLQVVDMTQTSILSIPSLAFESTGEVTIMWPPTLQTIETDAFICSSIRTLVLPALSKLEEKAFYECSNLKSIDFSAVKFTDIPKEAFKLCGNLEVINWGNTITTIGTSSFAQCGMKKVQFSESISTFAASSFARCTHLKQLDLSKSDVKELPSKVFSGCSNLCILMLPKKISSIAPDAFENIQRIQEIYYPGTESNGQGLQLPGSKIIVGKDYKDSSFAGISVVKQAVYNPDAQEFNDAKDTKNNQAEESNTTRNAFIGVLVVVCVCVAIWYKCDPYGVNGSEGVELEGELPWYRQITQQIGFRLDHIANRTPQFAA